MPSTSKYFDFRGKGLWIIFEDASKERIFREYGLVTEGNTALFIENNDYKLNNNAKGRLYLENLIKLNNDENFKCEGCLIEQLPPDKVGFITKKGANLVSDSDRVITQAYYRVTPLKKAEAIEKRLKDIGYLDDDLNECTGFPY